MGFGEQPPALPIKLEWSKLRSDTSPNKRYLSDTSAISHEEHEEEGQIVRDLLCDTISKRHCATGGVSQIGPLRHLPYPGGKCVVDGDYMTDETPRCKLQMCSPEDYSMSHISEGVNISGNIGRIAGEPQNIYNCLSASGDATGSIAIAKDIELEGQEALKNTVENRVELYRKLGVEEADV